MQAYNSLRSFNVDVNQTTDLSNKEAKLCKFSMLSNQRLGFTKPRIESSGFCTHEMKCISVRVHEVTTLKWDDKLFCF